MTAMPPLRDILNDTEADAVDVDYNFGLIEAHIAQELINRDGSVAMTGPLTTQPPTAPAHAATKAYVDNNIPVGSITMFAGGPGAVPPAPQTVPAGWALCDGSLKGTTDPLYAALFAVIGYTYGGTGGNFNLPNLCGAQPGSQGRFPVGRRDGDAVFGTLGQAGGSRDASVVTHAHDMKNHTHGMKGHTHSFTIDNESAHNHRIAIGSKNIAGGYGTGGAPSGWTGGINVIYGENLPLQTVTGRPYAVAPVDHFSKTLTVDVGYPYSDITAAHTHGVSNFSGPNDNTSNAPNDNTTDPAGGSGTNANLPPYLAINFIIRIG